MSARSSPPVPITLPSGVSLISDPETLVVNVVAAPTAEEMEGAGEGEAAAEEAEGEAAEGASEGEGEGAEEAPAADSE